MFIGNIKTYKEITMSNTTKNPINSTIGNGLSMTTKKNTSKKVSTVKNPKNIKMATRKAYYNDSDILQINSTVKMAKDSTLPYLTKKTLFVVSYLLKNDTSKNFTYTLDSITNLYRVEVANVAKSKSKKPNEYNFRKSFKSNEVVTVNDLKSAIQYIYFNNKRLFEFYRNDKGNYLVREVSYVPCLSELKERKTK